MRNASARENHPTREKATRGSPFLAWGDFHARSRVARSTIPEEKWGTTRSLHREPPHDQEGARVPSFGDIPLMFVTVKDGSSIFTEGQL